jgi:hypothetical protein
MSCGFCTFTTCLTGTWLNADWSHQRILVNSAIASAMPCIILGCGSGGDAAMRLCPFVLQAIGGL